MGRTTRKTADESGKERAASARRAAPKGDAATGKKTLLARLPEGLDNLAFDSKDRLFVSNFRHGWVVEVMPGGTYREVLRGGVIVPVVRSADRTAAGDPSGRSGNRGPG